MDELFKLVKKINALRESAEGDPLDLFVCDTCDKLCIGAPNEVSGERRGSSFICDLCSDVCFDCFMNGGDYYFAEGEGFCHDGCDRNGIFDGEIYTFHRCHKNEELNPKILEVIDSSSCDDIVIIKCASADQTPTGTYITLSFGDTFLILTVYQVDEDEKVINSYPAFFDVNWKCDKDFLAVSRGDIMVTFTNEKITISDITDSGDTVTDSGDAVTTISEYIVDGAAQL